MRVPARLGRILDAALEGRGPDKEDCTYLLRFPSESLEASMICAVADAVSRQRFRNQAVLLAQIGIETVPCPGGCKFCAFGEEHTTVETSEIPVEDIMQRASVLAGGGDLYALFLMTMHTYGFDRLLGVVGAVRQMLPSQTQIVVNLGDFDLSQARDLKAAGVDGAYHVCRLREGTDTSLNPEQRKATIRAIKEADLDWYFCCEPVGPEHSPVELVEQTFLGIQYGCFQHAAMRRVYIPSAPLSAHGQITERRLAQVVGVVALASLACAETKSIAVHEPNLLGLTAGANVVYAEAGANPRDTEKDTARNRGRDMAACRKMLYEAGFTAIQRGDGTTVPLDLASLHPPP